MNNSLNFLLIVDNDEDETFILRHLERTDYEISSKTIRDAEGLNIALASPHWDLIFSSFKLQEFSGYEAFEILKTSGFDIPIIFISETADEKTILEAIRSGISDFLLKSELSRIARVIERELKNSGRRKAGRTVEEQLRIVERRSHLVLSSAEMGIWERNLKTDEIYMSPESYQILNLTSKVNNLSDLVQNIHPEDSETLAKTVQRAIENHSIYRYEYRIIDSDGNIRWIASQAMADYENDGTPLYITGTITEITEQKKLEHNLKASESRFRVLAESNVAGVALARLNGDLSYVNDAFLNMLGYTREEFENSSFNWKNLTTPEAFEISLKSWEEALKNGSCELFEKEYFRKDGGRVPVLIVISRTEIDGEDYFVCAILDITERKKTEKELRESDENFRALVKATSQYVWAIIPWQNNYDYINWWTELTGQNAADAMGLGWLDMIHPEDREQTRIAWTDAFKNQKVFDTIYRLRLKNGHYNYMAVRGVPIFADSGEFRQWIGTMTDINDRKITEDNLRSSEEKLRHAQKLESVGRLAGGIAHDFNNLLTAINGYSDLLLRQIGDNDAARANLEKIIEAGERSAALTQQLLTFSHRQILQPQTINLNQIITQSLRLIERLLGANIHINSTLDSDIGKIKADPGQMSQIIINLALNSRDAMPKGGKIEIQTLSAQLETETVMQNGNAAPGSYVVLKFRDNGEGIDENILPKIFEPFYTTKEIGKGTGLGLATVYGIINQSNGFLNVSSRAGEGTTFEIYFPQSEQFSRPSARPSDSNISTVSPNESLDGTETILLVEDEQIVRNLTKEILKIHGYKIVEAQNGAEALEIFNSNKNDFDLLLTDIVMPKMDGHTLAVKVLQLKPEIKVLFTSGYAEDSKINFNMLNEKSDFIHKPFSQYDLAQRVRKLLNLTTDHNNHD